MLSNCGSGGPKSSALSPSCCDEISIIGAKNCGVEFLVNWERLKLELTKVLSEVRLGS